MGLLQDLKYAFRSLRNNPSFVAAAVIVLAIGIGANTATFSVVDALLLRPLPYNEPDQLVYVWHVPPHEMGMTKFSVSPANYIDWKAQNQSFEQMAAFGFSQPSLSGEGEPESVLAANVEPSLFSALRVRPALGRTFTPDEDKPDSHVVILTDSLWRVRYGADPAIIGKSIQVNGEPYTVIGVMPPAMNFPTAPIRLWMPLGWSAEERAVRGIHDYASIGRLKPGVTIQQAQAEMNTISSRLEHQYPEDNKGWGALVEPLRDADVGDVRPALLMMLGAVAFVLLIACANVGNLVLARTLARSKEISIRVAMGATRRRLLQQAVLEAFLLSFLGGIAGLLLAHLLVPLIVNFLGEDVARIAAVRTDWRVLLFTFGASILSGLLAGLLPAMRMMGRNVSEALKQGAGTTDTVSGGATLRRALVMIEMSLSLVLLVGAGLTVKSLINLQNVDPGIDRHNVLTGFVSIPTARYAEVKDRNRFFDEALSRIRNLPGVESAATISSIPVVQGGSRQPVQIEGHPQLPAAQQPEVAVRFASTQYFQTLRIPLLEGRDFEDGDTPESKPVIIISEAMAKRFWPGESAIGKRLTMTFAPEKIREVVGVVRDVKIVGLERQPIPTLYAPFRQFGQPFSSFVIRTSVKPETLSTAVSAAIHQIDSQQPVADIATYEQLFEASQSQRRFNMLLLSAFAAVALLLSAVGIYSVLAYAGRRRAREIGIRMALGAQPGHVLRMIMIEGLKPTLVGIAVGAVVAVALHRVLSSIVFGISATDPLTMGATAVVLSIVAVLASALPAYRATKVQPLTVLRQE